MERKMLALVVASLLVIGSVCQATIVMDYRNDVWDGATLISVDVHNGGLTGGPTNTYWHSSPSNIPAEWAQVAIGGTYIYNGATSIQAYPYSKVFNNTGELVSTGNQYTVTFGSGVYYGGATIAGGTISTSVIATENEDGSGNSVVLTTASRTSLAGDTVYSLNLATATGSIATAAIDGYYVQVLVECDGNVAGQAYFFDNILVTSEYVPEPATLALLSIGGLFLRKRK